MSPSAANSFSTEALTLLTILAPYLAAAAFILSLVCFGMALAFRVRLKRLMLGKNGSMEETLSVISRDVKELKKFRTELEAYLKLAEARMRGSVSGVGVVRFNPFSGDGSGGNQSFAIALLDEDGSGVVFSSLYSRDRVGMYAKPVEKGVSPFELTGEEKQAITEARHSTPAHKKKS